MIINQESTLVDVETLVPHPENPRRGDLGSIRESIRENGFFGAVIARTGSNTILAGEHRWRAARAEGLVRVPVIFVDVDDETATRILLADNATNDLATYNDERLAGLLRSIVEDRGTLVGTGYNDERLQALLAKIHGPIITKKPGREILRERFLVPPFSVLDSKQGYWVERKEAWISMGLRSEEGRDEALTFRHFRVAGNEKRVAYTSIFDPVLAELLVRWFCPRGGRVLDPFAGGSVRGFVSAMLGRRYTGIDLSLSQVETNRKQWAQIAGDEAEETISDPEALTPVERRGSVWVKRDDLFEVAGVRGGKVRACWDIARGATGGLVTAGSRQSPQVNIVAHVAKALGLPARCHTPTGELSPEVQAARDAGAEIVQHDAGYNNVIIKRSRDDASERGWREIPFGMECEEAVEAAAAQVINIPTDAKRLVVPVGSGMNLAGILHGLRRVGNSIPVVGVVVGADPEKRLDRWAPDDWRDRVTLVNSPHDYHTALSGVSLDGVLLDPIYEAKCVEFLRADDCLWVIGVRQTASRPTIDETKEKLSAVEGGDPDLDSPLVTPTWIVGNSERIAELAPGSYDFVLSCPPYGDLERYSRDEEDLSNMKFEDFRRSYRTIIARTADLLSDNAFAAFVVGDYRDPAGNYRDFVSLTISAFRDAGLHLFNEGIYLQPLATVPMRAQTQFAKGRKLGKCHQNVLVFLKGDAGMAISKLPVDIQAGEARGAHEAEEGRKKKGLKPSDVTRSWKLTHKTMMTQTLRCGPPFSQCGGACCGKTETLWPTRIGRPDRCEWLGPNGCVMGEDRPVGCQLYPLLLHKNGVTLVRHFLNNYICKEAWNDPDAPTMFEALRPNLETLFGADEIERASEVLSSGRDALLDVPPAVYEAMVRELGQDSRDESPLGISGKAWDPAP